MPPRREGGRLMSVADARYPIPEKTNVMLFALSLPAVWSLL